MMQTAKLNTSGPAEGPTAEQLRGWLEGLNDEDLGRYKMYQPGAMVDSMQKLLLGDGLSAQSRTN
jgi:hypothetical protein